MNQPTILIGILIASWLQIAHSADIHLLNKVNAKGYLISMSGKINRGDYDRILSTILQREELPSTIFIEESPGGDVIEAIKLGRIIRRGLVQVQPQRSCNSACAFIVFAGINHVKGFDTKIGLHRPRYDKEYFAGLSLNEANDKYSELENHVASYLEEMDVPTVVTEKIMSTPSSSIEYLSLDAYVDLAGRNPPAFEEWLIARCGVMSPQEADDVSLAYAYETYHSYSSSTDSADRMVAERSKEDARKAESFSSGYREYVLKRFYEIGDCKKAAIKKEQAKYLYKLIEENADRELVNP